MKVRSLDVFGFFLGAYATIVQIILMREALVMGGGNELLLGIALAMWLLGVASGAVAAGTRVLSGRAAWEAAFFSPLLMAGEVLLLRSHRSWLSLDMGEVLPPGLMSLVLLLGLVPAGATIGYLFTRAACLNPEARRQAAASLYGFEAVGALFAGVLFTLVLAGRVPHLAMVGASGAIVSALVFSFHRTTRRRWLWVAAAPALVVAATVAGFWLDLHGSQHAHEELGIDGDLVAHADSEYGRLLLTGSGDEYQLYVDGRFERSFPDPWNRRPPVHVALSQHPDPQKILLIGGGAPDRLEAALAHGPSEVVLTHLDSRSFEICRPFFAESTLAALEDPRVKVIEDDGRRYLSKTRKRFDAILVHGSPPLSGRANRYHTAEFFRAAVRALEPGGTLSVMSSGGANVMAREASSGAAVTMNTLKRVFDHVAIVPGQRTSFHASLAPDVVTRAPAVLAKRFDSRVTRSVGFDSSAFSDRLEPSRLASFEMAIADCPPRINTDSVPLAYLANLQLWERSSVDQAALDHTWTGLVERAPWVWVAVPGLLWLIGWLISLVRGGGGRYDALFSIGTTGAVGMGVQMMVLLAFQSAAGVLYAGLGLLVAAFMGGLAAGAFLSRRFGLGPGRWAGVLSDILTVVLLGGTALLVVKCAGNQWILVAWSLVAGAVTGWAFPVFIALAARNRKEGEAGAVGPVEAADHLGAAFGALVTGVVWIPVLGIPMACLFFSALKGVSVLGQVVTSRRSH